MCCSVGHARDVAMPRRFAVSQATKTGLTIVTKTRPFYTNI